MSKGKRPDPLPPVPHDGDDDEPILMGPPSTNGPAKASLALAAGIPESSIGPLLDRVESIVQPVVEGAKEAVRRGVEAHEQIANEILWTRRVQLVALASDNGKASEAESKDRLRRMVSLMDSLDEIEEEIFGADDEESEDDEDPGIVPPRRFK